MLQLATAPAAGWRCGWIIVERLAEAVGKEAATPALARLIGRPVRELAGVLASLGYKRTPQRDGGAPSPWRLLAPKRKRNVAALGDNAFAALAAMMPAPDRSRCRRGGRA